MSYLFLSIVVSTREAVLDSENFKTLSEIACHQSENARGELIKFDPILFREKLVIIIIIVIIMYMGFSYEVEEYRCGRWK